MQHYIAAPKALVPFKRLFHNVRNPKQTLVGTATENMEPYAMKQATRTSWKTLPSPDERVRLVIPEIFSDSVGDRIRGGHIPVDMDDRWFIYFENDWLHFHRSWTGAQIFALRLDDCPAGVRVTDAWASRDLEQYRSAGVKQDQQLVLSLIHNYFGQ